ncbi:MAG TPA: LamG-like jellyroll fold domain-containing protein [Candidatus Limnocylindria bacterium]|nr:LamG-like jellyroll fold domain-containing protein [Candidatus Limnocylindria bacterium]
MRLYSRALSAAEITTLATPPGGNEAPVAVDDSYTTPESTPLTVAAPGVLANDTDADANALTAIKVSDPAHGSVSLAATGGFTYTPSAGYSGPDSFTYRANDGTVDSNTATVSLTVSAAENNAVVLDGTNDYVTFGSATALGSTTFTLELWFKRTGPGVGVSTGSGGLASAIPLLTKGRGEGDATANLNMNYFLGIDVATGRLAADFEDTASGGNHPVIATTPITSDVWHHAAATYDGATWRIYLDGNLDATLTVSATPEATSIQHAGLGTAMTSTGVAAGFFAGLVDEARVWNAARSQALIQSTRDLEITSPTATLRGRWGLNEGVGTTAADSSGNAVTGTLTNGATWAAGFVPPPFNASPTVSLDAPADGAGGVSLAPPLAVTPDDTDSSTVTVTFYGRPSASGSFSIIATQSDVSAGAVTSAPWAGRQSGQRYEWYATVSDGSSTTTGPTWTFTTSTGSDPVLVGAGDIASCTSSGDEATAEILLGVSGTVFTAGDNVYQNGLLSEFNACYAPSWGQASIKSRTRPTTGNHDFGNGTNNGDGYFDYYNGAGAPTGIAGDRPTGFYSYELGQWHIVVLNTECAQAGVGCTAGSPQETWLRTDLEGHASSNVLAIIHRPRFSSGASGGNAALQPLWQALYDNGADLVLAGHDHHYERFAPIDPTGALDTAYGIPEIIVGTGGVNNSSVGTPKPNSIVSNDDTFGVLRLDLHANSYDWRFMPVDGETFVDSGTGSVHAAPNHAPTATVGLNTTSPKTTDTLTATATKADVDGDAVTLTYVWKVNGTTRQTTLTSTSLTDTFTAAVPGNGDRGDTITVTVTPNDGSLDGTPVSDSATVVNAAPVVDSAFISPSAPLTTDTLSVAVTSHDVDNDARTHTYQWTRNGIDLAGANAASLDLGTVGAVAGDQFAVRVAANDGLESSTTLTAASVTVRAIAFRSAATGQVTRGTTLSLAKPPGTTADDVLVAAIDVLGAVSVTPPAGWTLVRSDVNGSSLRQQVYVRAVESPEPNSYAWLLGTSGTASGVIVAYRGVDPVQPIDAAGGQPNASSSTITAPSITTQVASAQLVSLSGVAANAAVSPPSGLVERAESLGGSGNTRIAIELADAARPVIGPTGAITASATKAGPNIGQTIALRPAGAPPIEPTAPTAPQNLTAVAAASSVDLAWSAPSSTGGSAITGYNIYRDGALLTSVGPSVRSYSDLAVSPGDSYSYHVTAVNGAGESPPSNSVVSGLPGPVSVPGAPTGLTATRLSKPRTIQLTWTPPSSNGGASVTNYRIYRGTSLGGEASLPIATVGAVTSYKDTTLQSGVTYYYVIRAVNSAGDGAQSNEAFATAR